MIIKNIKLKNIVDIFIFFLLIFEAFPLLFLIVFSFSDEWRWPFLFPSNFSLNSWRYIFSNQKQNLDSIIMTFKIGFSVVFLNILLALPVANALSRYSFKFKKTFDFLFSLPILIPPITFLIGLQKSFFYLNLNGSFFTIIIATCVITFPYMLKSLTLSFDSIDFNWQYQSYVLGANYIKTFFYILLPMLAPGLISGSSICFLISSSQYLLVLLLGSGSIITLTIHMFPFLNGGNLKIGSCYSLIFVLFCFINFWILDLFFKFFTNYRHGQ